MNKMKKTLTVGELIKHLENEPANMLVVATWEGVIAPITVNNFTHEKAFKEVDSLCLIIDVEDYC